MATIEKREGKQGVQYRVRVRVKGEAPRSRTFTRLTDAKAWAAAAETDLGRGRYVATAADRRRTLADLIDAYVQDHLPHQRAIKSADTTVQRLGWWRENLGFLTLDKLTPDRIEEAKRKLRQRTTRHGKPLTPATMNRYVAALSAACKCGLKTLRWLPSNPVRELEKGPETSGAGRDLTRAQVSALLEACKADPCPNIHPFVLLALTTGARYSSLRMLTWDRVNFEDRRIDLGETKNGERQVVNLIEPATSALRAHHAADPTGEGWVFKGAKDSAPAALDWTWRRIKAAAGFTADNNLRIHDLRHTAATFMAASGASEFELMAAIGWLTPSMAKRYTHLRPDHARPTVERAAAAMFRPEPTTEDTDP